MVNGALLLNKNLNIKKHYFKTIKTFVLIFFFSFVVSLIKLPLLEGVNFKSFMQGVINLKLGWSNHLWFLLSLAILYIIFPLYKFLFDKHKKLSIFLCLGLIFLSSFRSIILFISGISSNQSIYNLVHNFLTVFDKFFYFMNLDRFLFSSAYFILGGILAFYFSSIKQKLNTHKIVNNIFLVVILIVFTFGNFFYGRTNKIADIVWNGYPTIFTFVLTTTLFILCQINCNENQYGNVTLVANQCMGIYVFHLVVLNYVHLFFSKVIIVGSPKNLIVTAVTIAISFLITFVLSKIKYLNKLLKL